MELRSDLGDSAADEKSVNPHLNLTAVESDSEWKGVGCDGAKWMK